MKNVTKENCLATKFPDIAKQWHSTKNENITPYDIVAGSNKKFWWKCDVADDHEWNTTCNERTYGQHNCPCCSGNKVVLSNCFATIYPNKAALWHPTKNGNLTPYDFMPMSDKIVFWICEKGHEWQTYIKKLSSGQGCPYCSGQRVCSDNCFATNFPELTKEWHPTKNGVFTPYDFTCMSDKKVCWICKNGHEWTTRIKKRSAGQGCPTCNESQGEKEIARVLDELKIKYKREKSFKSCRNKRPLLFDFIIKTKNGLKIAEYQGQQHYMPVKFGKSQQDEEYKFSILKINDKIKKDWCEKMGVPLLAIPFWEYNNIETILDQFIKEN